MALKNLETDQLQNFWPRKSPGISGLALAFGALLASGVVSGCGNKPATQAAAFTAMPVTTRVLHLEPIPESSEYLSTLKWRQSAAINPQVAGQIVKIDVKSGDHVKANASLMQIDPSKQEATVNSQEAARNAQAATLQYAKDQYERSQQLYNSGLIAKQEFDSAKSAYEAALAQFSSLDAQVREQQVQLKYYEVTAPSEGIVGDIPVHVGDYVTTSTRLTTLDQPSNLEAYIYVPVDHSKDLRVGEPVDLLDDSGKVIAHSAIFFVSSEVDSTTQSVLAKALIANPANKFRTDQYVRTRITWRTKQGLQVPILAVSRINGQFFIFVAQKSGTETVTKQKVIQVGDIVGNNYVVQGGLQPGEHIIIGAVAGFQFLADGMPVKETVEDPSSASGAASH